MAKAPSNQLDQTFAALGDPTRREILRHLATGDRSVGELAQPFDMSLPAVSKHLRVLERAGLVSRSIDGRTHTLHLEAGPMREATQWLAFYQRFWGGALDSLGEFLQATSPENNSKALKDNTKRRPKK